MAPLLETHGLTVRFGGLVAVDHVDLQVPDSGIVGLIGPNGAGKTTLVDALTGFVPATGTIRFGGREIQDWPAFRRSRSGLVRTFQSVELFDDLTVTENLRVHADPFSRFDWLVDVFRRPEHGRDLADVLELLGLIEEADTMPRALPHGTRRLIGVARALASRPRLLVLDEPAAGLDADETLELAARMRDVAGTRISILIIDHDMDFMMGLCDDVYVLNFGAVIAHGPPKQIRTDPSVLDAYLGDRTAGAL